MRRCSAMACVVAIGGLVHALQPTHAHAQPQDLTVAIRACDGLDPNELTRLTRLELGGTTSGRMEVVYRCEGEEIAIELVDRQRDLRVSRTMPRDCCRESAERTLALLAAGLHAVARPVLADAPTPTPPAKVTPDAAVATPTPEAPIPPWLVAPAPLPTPRFSFAEPGFQPAQADQPEEAEEPLAAASDHDIGAAAQVRFYNVGNGATLYGARLRYTYWPSESFGVGPIAEADFGSVARSGGQVDVRVFHFGGMASWRFARTNAVDASLSPFAAASVVQLEGVASQQDIDNEALTGATGAGGLRLGALLGSGPVRLDAMLEAGVLFRAPRGEVAALDTTQVDTMQIGTVQVDGLWLGAGLGVDFGWVNGGSAVPPQTAPPEVAAGREVQ